MITPKPVDTKHTARTGKITKEYLKEMVQFIEKILQKKI